MKLLENLAPRDIIAVLVVIGALWLRSQNIDGVVSAILLAVVAFYFGSQYLPTGKTK